LFQGFFEGLIGLRDGQRRIAQTMGLAGLMRHTGHNRSGRQAEGWLIITDPAANPIAQVLDGLPQTCRQSWMIG
jgi:hypothetical protein